MTVPTSSSNVNSSQVPMRRSPVPVRRQNQRQRLRYIHNQYSRDSLENLTHAYLRFDSENVQEDPNKVYTIQTNYDEFQYQAPNLSSAIWHLIRELRDVYNLNIFETPLFQNQRTQGTQRTQRNHRRFLELSEAGDLVGFIQYFEELLNESIGFEYSVSDEPFILEVSEDMDVETLQERIRQILEDNASSEGSTGFIALPPQDSPHIPVAIRGNLANYFLELADPYIINFSNEIIEMLDYTPEDAPEDTLKYTLVDILSSLKRMVLNDEMRLVNIDII